jgi:Ca2+-binding EF-hand superfamily protein
MGNLHKLFAMGLLLVFTGLVLSVSAQAKEGSGHGAASFSAFDMDGNGFISEYEYNSVRQQRMAARASEGKKMRCAQFAPSYADLDTDGDGKLSPEELTIGQSAHKDKCKSMGKGEGKGKSKGKGMKGKMPSFSDFDLDGDGVITQSEFNEGHAKHMNKMAAQGNQMKHMDECPGFSGIDTNGDGEISAQEFSDHQTGHHKQMQERHGQQDH